MKRRSQGLIALVAAAGLVMGLAACTDDSSYEPAAYGQNGQCYYVQNPQEATVLLQDHKCLSGWTPTLMPESWLLMYYAFYSSSFYRNTYVPSSYRSTYSSKLNSFYSANKTTITQQASKGTYRDSSGQKVSGKQAGITIGKSGSSTIGGKSGGTFGTKSGGSGVGGGTKSGGGLSGSKSGGTGFKSGGSSGGFKSGGSSGGRK